MKYEVLQRFQDKHTKEIYEKDSVIEMTAKRAKEAIQNLEKYDGEFLKAVETKKEK